MLLPRSQRDITGLRQGEFGVVAPSRRDSVLYQVGFFFLLAF